MEQIPKRTPYVPPEAFEFFFLSDLAWHVQALGGLDGTHIGSLDGT